jgi:hypothetical protein
MGFYPRFKGKHTPKDTLCFYIANMLPSSKGEYWVVIFQIARYTGSVGDPFYGGYRMAPLIQIEVPVYRGGFGIPQIYTLKDWPDHVSSYTWIRLRALMLGHIYMVPEDFISWEDLHAVKRFVLRHLPRFESDCIGAVTHYGLGSYGYRTRKALI